MSRPEKPIDWDKVDELLMSGCKGTEIAPHFDMHPNTFYDRVLEKYNVSFTEYSTSKRAHGEGLFKLISFKKAMRGDNNQLTLNLKNRCGYTDGKTSSNDLLEMNLTKLVQLLESGLITQQEKPKE